MASRQLWRALSKNSDGTMPEAFRASICAKTTDIQTASGENDPDLQYTRLHFYYGAFCARERFREQPAPRNLVQECMTDTGRAISAVR